MDSRLPPAVPEVLDARFSDLAEHFISELQTLSRAAQDPQRSLIDFLSQVRRLADDEIAIVEDEQQKRRTDDEVEIYLLTHS